MADPISKSMANKFPKINVGTYKRLATSKIGILELSIIFKKNPK
jgi:hypothetical protein